MMPSVSVDISNDNALMQATVGELVQAILNNGYDSRKQNDVLLSLQNNLQCQRGGPCMPWFTSISSDSSLPVPNAWVADSMEKEYWIHHDTIRKLRLAKQAAPLLMNCHKVEGESEPLSTWVAVRELFGTLTQGDSENVAPTSFIDSLEVLVILATLDFPQLPAAPLRAAHLILEICQSTSQNSLIFSLHPWLLATLAASNVLFFCKYAAYLSLSLRSAVDLMLTIQTSAALKPKALEEGSHVFEARWAALMTTDCKIMTEKAHKLLQQERTWVAQRLGALPSPTRGLESYMSCRAYWTRFFQLFFIAL